MATNKTLTLREQFPTLTQNINGVEVQLSEMEYEETIAKWEENLALAEAEKSALAMKSAEKTALLARLGITAEEAKLLLS